ncbi:MAG TPA: LON peptidase substrate-binding domain-containing protein [Polyangiaceae bacterium]|nr:LON peptidase substrate-binding domain-containing protein [Polyangiaceae bacterium]
MSSSSSRLSARDLARVPVFPLPNVALFPGASLPLHVFEPRYRQMTEDILAGDRLIVVARLCEGYEADYEGKPAFHPVCGIGRVVQDEARPDGRYDLVVQGLSRVRVTRELPTSRAYRVVSVELLPDQTPSDAYALLSWQRELAGLWEKLRPYLPESVRGLLERAYEVPSAGARIDMLAAAVVADPDERQRFLEELDPSQRSWLLVEKLRNLLSALSAPDVRAQSRLN